jgi:hypothetical protein
MRTISPTGQHPAAIEAAAQAAVLIIALVRNPLQNSAPVSITLTLAGVCFPLLPSPLCGCYRAITVASVPLKAIETYSRKIEEKEFLIGKVSNIAVLCTIL